MRDGMKQSFDEAKKNLESLAQYRLDLEEDVANHLKEVRSEGERDIAEVFRDASLEAAARVEERTIKLKKQTAEKAAKQEQKIAEKYDKKIAEAKAKAASAKKGSKQEAAAEKELKDLEADKSSELEEVNDKAQKEFEKAQKRAEKQLAYEKRSGILNSYGKVGSAVNDLVSLDIASITSSIADFANQLKSSINTIGGYKSSIDTRLQGSKQSTAGGSYWDKISKDITGAAAISPLVKQSDIAAKVQSMVNQGISYNVEQRAFLATISDKIATTFESTNGSLARLVRIQQQDSTAARLGMESALNSFLNNMYETTEYMSDIMSNIRSSLEEAEALMSSTEATEFDYQVNKWLGSLYSVGMSSSAVESIGNALGDLAAGKISGITSDGAGNLIVMAANNAGLSVADLLKDGLDDSSTNRLMTAMVEYLKGIYNDTNGSLVLQQQYADVFGMSAADLKAVANLSTADISNTANQNLSYSGMLSQLNAMANSMYSRTSTGELMTNLTDNLKYTMAAGIANNPALYWMYTMADILDSVAGGIDFSLPLYMGTGTAQTFNVADLMKVGSLSGSIISGIASMMSVGGNGGITGDGLLKAFGVGSSNSVVRGTGSGLITTGGATYSSSGYVGNASSGDVYEKTMTDQQDTTNSQVAEAAEENNEATTTDINNNILLMYQLLQDVTNGTLSFKVDMGDSSAWSQVMNPTY